MGTLKVNGIRHTGASSDAISLDSGGTCTANITNNLSNRNLIINGAMQVAQHGTSVAWAANGYLTCDRWNHVINNSAGRWTAKQTADGPDGFRRCLELDVTTADTSIAANEHALLQYKWEGQDVQSLAKGTSSAKKFTISFYVKGNGSATYMCELFDRTNTRLTRQQFSVTSSWSRVTLTFDNETSNGTLNDDNSHELDLQIWLHAGSDFTSGTYTANTWAGQTNADRAVGISSLFSSTDNYFRITGVQLEVGDYATDFEQRSYGDEWLRCARYFYMLADGSEADGGVAMSQAYSTTQAHACVRHPVKMRAAPSVYVVEGTNYFKWIGQGASDLFDDIDSNGYPTTTASEIYLSGNLSCTAGAAGYFRTANAAARIGFNAEL